MHKNGFSWVFWWYIFANAPKNNGTKFFQLSFVFEIFQYFMCFLNIFWHFCWNDCSWKRFFCSGTVFNKKLIFLRLLYTNIFTDLLHLHSFSTLVDMYHQSQQKHGTTNLLMLMCKLNTLRIKFWIGKFNLSTFSFGKVESVNA